MPCISHTTFNLMHQIFVCHLIRRNGNETVSLFPEVPLKTSIMPTNQRQLSIIIISQLKANILKAIGHTLEKVHENCCDPYNNVFITIWFFLT